jgi:CRISPR-associated endonuclease/helicase Cas3
MIYKVIDLEKDLLNTNYTFFAHPDETIWEHTTKCINFFQNICDAKHLNEIFENISEELLHDEYSMYRDLFMSLMINTIVFHDIGKINPGFQKLKMHNKQFANVASIENLGSQHSIISAIIYLQYFMPDIYAIENKNIKETLRLILYINSYVISRHHCSLEDFQKFLCKFYEGDYVTIKQSVFEYISTYLSCGKELFSKDYIAKSSRYVKKAYKKNTKYNICCYTYERLLFSILVASDYYATTMQETGYINDSYGTISNIDNLFKTYKCTRINQQIEAYKDKQNISISDIDNITDINELRIQIYISTEKKLLENINESIFYLEAPTGSGKSNTALNLSFQLAKNDSNLNKILYIYPYNTLVEQNEKILKEIFENDTTAIRQIKVVNSVTPIKKYYDEDDKYDEVECTKALLDRQFFNYPISLSTHVTLFNIMFGNKREDAFSFHQLANSIIVLDEIQSYKNSIWTEVITFLKSFAKLLNIKIIIMSATLPDFDILSQEQQTAIRLLDNSDRYFKNPCFCKRVSDIDYSLFSYDKDTLLYQIKELITIHLKSNKKLLVEFINKKTANVFYELCKEDLCCDVYLLTGDDNSIERFHILKSVEDAPKNQPLLLIATQVIEAGVDLKSIDIGFKDISILDSEEQFLGRINRSNTGTGKVYFFDYNNAAFLYKTDSRNCKDLSLHNVNMRNILINKDFNTYYEKVMELVKIQNDNLNLTVNIQYFWNEHVGKLNQPEIAKRMKLINDDNQSCQVYLSRIIYDIDGNKIDGEQLWHSYRELLVNKANIPYAEFKVRLSQITSQMNYFIYRVKYSNFIYNDHIGEIYYIENGDDYFDNGHLMKDRFESNIGLFI